MRSFRLGSFFDNSPYARRLCSLSSDSTAALLFGPISRLLCPFLPPGRLYVQGRPSRSLIELTHPLPLLDVCGEGFLTPRTAVLLHHAATHLADGIAYPSVAFLATALRLHEPAPRFSRRSRGSLIPLLAAVRLKRTLTVVVLTDKLQPFWETYTDKREWYFSISLALNSDSRAFPGLQNTLCVCAIRQTVCSAA